jgi:hypothetical protein
MIHSRRRSMIIPEPHLKACGTHEQFRCQRELSADVTALPLAGTKLLSTTDFTDITDKLKPRLDAPFSLFPPAHF